MSKLVPKLRFKEFSGEWEEKKLGEVCDVYNGSTPKTTKSEYWNGKINWITPAEMGNNKYIHSSIRKITKKGLENSNTKLLPVNSIILSCRAPIGYVAINKKEMTFNQGCKGILAKNICYEFLYYLLGLSKTRLENLGSGNTFKEISTNNLKNMEILLPKSPKEQQKIANTLSSLDSLIEAQQRKVEALKKHKKGLMQQLFPAEGENEPKLRFKEFSGEWEEKKLGDVFNYKNGGSFEKYIVENGEYNLITLNSIDISGELKKEHKTIDFQSEFLNKNDLVMVLSDVAHGNFLGLTAIIPENEKYILNQRMGALKLKALDNIEYLRFYINNNQKYFKTHGHGSSQQNLSKNDILGFKIKLPTQKEQQKIANTLSSLDSLIEAQQRKVEALKKHKKGLMQQMFVSGEE